MESEHRAQHPDKFRLGNGKEKLKLRFLLKITILSLSVKLNFLKAVND